MSVRTTESRLQNYKNKNKDVSVSLGVKTCYLFEMAGWFEKYGSKFAPLVRLILKIWHFFWQFKSNY